MRAAIYARFSTDKQSESSIDDQFRNCERYAERNDMTVITHFDDKAVSGASKDRPSFKAMEMAALNGEFDVLLVDDLSRLSRDEVEMKKVIRNFKFRRLRIVGVSDGYDSDTKGEKIQSTMRGLMNEMYLDDLREKTHRGLYGKALNGYSAGGRTYGYKRAPVFSSTKTDVHGNPEVEAVRREVSEDEAKWVNKIFEWYANGMSPKKIAHKLNALGVPSARRSTWAANAIYGDFKDGTGLLNNRMYIGEYIWNRSEWLKDPDTGKRRRRKRPQSEWVITPMEELRIVSDELWNAVQKRHLEIRNNSTKLREILNNPKTRSRSGKYLFSGLLKCGCCGANYTIYSSTSYGCSTNIERGNAACKNRLRVPRKLAEERLLEAVRQELLSEEAIDLFIKETTSLLHQRNQQPKTEAKALKRNLSQAERQVTNLMNAIKAGIITPTTKAELERAEAEYNRAKAELEAVEGTDEALATALPDAAQRYRKLMANLGGALERDTGRAREGLKTLLGFVRLIPASSGGFLEAEIRRSPEGLMRLALQENIEFKARLVAGAGFEPAAFRL